MTLALTPCFDDAGPWERALQAFLIEKEGRSGSRRTVDAYTSMLKQCFATVKQPPDRVPAQRCLPGRTVPVHPAECPRRQRSAPALPVSHPSIAS